MWEERVGHVLVEERSGAYEVEGYSVWTLFRDILSATTPGV